jgi:CrcB protein
MTTALLVAAAGAAGVLARYGLSALAAGDGVLWTTLAINVAGSFLLGLLLGSEWGGGTARSVAGVGFLGGFTTYSTFSVQAVTTAESGRWLTAGFYLSTSLVLGVAAAVAGLALGRLLR